LGQRTLLVKIPAETGGLAYEIEYFHQPYTGRTGQPLHFHRSYTEQFEILAAGPGTNWGTTSSAPRRPSCDPAAWHPHRHPWSDSDAECTSGRSSPPARRTWPDECLLNTGITFSGWPVREGPQEWAAGHFAAERISPLDLAVTGSAEMPIGPSESSSAFWRRWEKLAGYQAT